MTLQLLADSACDLPLSFFKDNNVTLLPLSVQIEENHYLDLVTIPPKQVFEEIRNGALPKTSQASPQTMLEEFTKLAQTNTSGLYIAFSSELSGTYSTAVMVMEQVKEEHPNLDLTIIDTKCASLGHGLLVKHAVEMLEKGKQKEEIISEISTLAPKMVHLFTVEDLEFLARGGRVSKASAFVGGLLNIKPLLHVEDGKLVPLEKIRGKKKVLKRMVELAVERGITTSTGPIAISHGDEEETALQLKELLQGVVTDREFYINTLGASVGSHAGPGTLALFFIPSN
ncbi:DegV family protein [Mangrovibacillus cuniculi]|uniref:DegV family protein n=1 Tax=Mangrovibacillus cuniculi TaxID=2593652 RepID=A0A7S8C9S6_9BACI|nr:DegV family protein [Mangrovibacillus cuniculi]QPC46051.1 DegV family protein [Mangrovibacillus cuniculi]